MRCDKASAGSCSMTCTVYLRMTSDSAEGDTPWLAHSVARSPSLSSRMPLALAKA